MSEGFSVRRVSRGIDAIVAAQNPNIQILLLDIKMPGRYNGLDAAHAIRQSHPEKEILFVTVHRENEEYHRRATELGLEDIPWVRKPNTEQQLHDLVNAVRRAAKEVEKRRTRLLLEKGEEEGIRRRPLLRLLQRDSQIADDIVDDLLTEGRPALITDLLDKLCEVRALLTHGEHDVQTLQMVFGPFKKAVLDRLWDVFEDADLNHRTIASQLDVAVRQLSSAELEKRHVAALEFVLKQLARTKLSREDVRECKRKLRYNGIEILIDLGRYREPLLDLYLNEEEGEEENSVP
jgi:CheY-like chemotaxis protein